MKDAIPIIAVYDDRVNQLVNKYFGVKSCKISFNHFHLSNRFETAHLCIADNNALVVVVVVGQTVGSISSKTLAYDCLYILELCTASTIATRTRTFGGFSVQCLSKLLWVANN